MNERPLARYWKRLWSSGGTAGDAASPWEVALSLARRAWGAATGAIRGAPWFAAGLAAYALALVLLRPATPFEWDEILFLRALDSYSIVTQSPHPPGYPVYVVLGVAMRWLVRDPLLALQLVGVLAAVAALVLARRAALRFGGSATAGVAAAGLLGFLPGLVFNVNVGLSDVTSSTATIAAAIVLLAAADRPGLLVWGAIASALAVGVRPQVVPALLPVGLLALAAGVRARAWRDVGRALLAGIGASIVVWIPVAMISGPEFWEAVKKHGDWVAVSEQSLRLPGATLRSVASQWLLRPLGDVPLAVGFWALVLAGTVVWWRRGQRRLVLVIGACATTYVGVAFFTLNMSTAVRYFLPAAPFLAILASGVLACRGRRLRILAGALVGVWCISAAVWTAPALTLRRQPAPLWEGLTWVRDHFDPSRTTVVFDGVFGPHVRYVLERAGFTIVRFVPSTPYGSDLRDGGDVVMVFPEEVPGGERLLGARWTSGKMVQLTRGRYLRCVVTRAAGPEAVVFSPDWRRREADWELWGTGAVRLAGGQVPRVLHLTAGDRDLEVKLPGRPWLDVKRGRSFTGMLMPGPGGCLLVAAPEGLHAHFPAVTSEPVRPDDVVDGVATSHVVPLAAHQRLPDGSRWQSDVTLYNPQAVPLPVAVQFLPTDRDNSAAPTLAWTLPPGAVETVPDALGWTGLASWGSSGALLLYAGIPGRPCEAAECGFVVFSRTYLAGLQGIEGCSGDGLPAVSPSSALGAGARTALVAPGEGTQGRALGGGVSLSPAPLDVSVKLLRPDGTPFFETTLHFPPFGHLISPLPGFAAGSALEIQTVGEGSGPQLVPFLSLMEAGGQETTHVLAGAEVTGSGRKGGLSALPRPLPSEPGTRR